jgi:hypothetical protein
MYSVAVVVVVVVVAGAAVGDTSVPMLAPAEGGSTLAAVAVAVVVGVGEAPLVDSSVDRVNRPVSMPIVRVDLTLSTLVASLEAIAGVEVDPW